MTKFRKRFDPFFNKYQYLILVILITVILRLPTLFEPNRYADEDIYLTLGLGLRRGLVFYRDIHDNKPPLIYLVAAIAGNVPVFRFILLLWHSANLVIFFHLAQKFFKKPLFTNLSTALFALLTTIPLTEGNIANGEIFMIMPVTAAVLFLLQKQPRYALAGFLFSLGFLFKVPVAFEFCGLLFWLVFYQSKNLKKIILFLLTFSIPILLTIIYYTLKGAGQPYIRAALMQNIGYLSSWEGGGKPFFLSGLFVRASFLLALILLIYRFKKQLGSHFGLLAVWTSTALFGAFLSGRPYPHYLIQILPPLCLLLFAVKKDITKITFSLLLLLLLILGLRHYRFWYYQSLPYYKNFISFITGEINQSQYYQFFGDRVLVNQQVASYIQKRTAPDDRIFVWGTEPAVYALSHRLPLGRFTVAYHVSDFDGHIPTINQLKINPAKFIVYYPDAPDFQGLDRFVARYYFVDQQFGPAIIFQLRN